MSSQVDQLVEAARSENWREVETLSRSWLSNTQFYIPHLFLITALIKTMRFDDADAEFESLLGYKFNLSDRIDGFPDVARRYSDRMGRHFNKSVMTDVEASLSGGRKSGVAKWDVLHQTLTREAFLQEAGRVLDASIETVKKTDLGSARLRTFGSCFAANLTTKLVGRGVDAASLLLEETVNSTFANRTLLEVISRRGHGAAHEAMRDAYEKEFLDNIATTLAPASHIILTMGVAPSFFTVDTNEYVFAKSYLRPLATGKVRMRTTTCSENVENLNAILDALSTIAPTAQKIITVSPVPLDGTTEMRSAVVADCVSKSILRAAVHEVLTTRRDVIYFPAFEIVRWLSGYTASDVFGNKDQNSRHISDWLVDFITEKFIDKFFEV